MVEPAFLSLLEVSALEKLLVTFHLGSVPTCCLLCFWFCGSFSCRILYFTLSSRRGT